MVDGGDAGVVQVPLHPFPPLPPAPSTPRHVVLPLMETSLTTTTTSTTTPSKKPLNGGTSVSSNNKKTLQFQPKSQQNGGTLLPRTEVDSGYNPDSNIKISSNAKTNNSSVSKPVALSQQFLQTRPKSVSSSRFVHHYFGKIHYRTY